MSTWTHERARIASLTRSRSADDPDLIEARRNLRAMRLAEHVEQVLDGAPPLTDEQRQMIARLLVGGAVGPAPDAELAEAGA